MDNEENNAVKPEGEVKPEGQECKAKPEGEKCEAKPEGAEQTAA